MSLTTAGLVHGAESHGGRNPAAQDVRKFQVRPGLRLDVVATEPLLENPVAFSIDGQGRYYIAETHRYRDAIFDITANTPWLLDDLSFRTVNDRAAFLARTFVTNYAILTNRSELVRRVEDRDGDGTAETSSIFADGFRDAVAGTAAGVLAQGTNVWFTSIPDLWRFTSGDHRGDASGKAIARDRLATGLGVHISVSGHDVHGLIRGPDGRIYFSFGDRGVCVTNREGAVLDVADTGGVLRCEPDGRDLEIFCVGLRNPQELAFDDLGNLWTVDNDTAGTDPCRVLHLIEGADYGWRASYQHMKGFGPWVQEELWRGGLDGQPPLAGIVSQGPAGLAFHPGPGLVPGLAGRFVHADFPGGIWAYDLRPRGDTYIVANKEKVLWNCWPTDVDYGPDGALYVLDWVQGWTPPGKGRIYRLTETNATGPTAGVTATATAEARRWLAEGASAPETPALLRRLGHADRRVRLESQWELAARAPASLPALVDVALKSDQRLARVHALWAIRQALRTSSTAAVAPTIEPLLGLLTDADPEVRGQAALTVAERGRGDDAARLAGLVNDGEARTRLLSVQAATVLQRRARAENGVRREVDPGLARAVARALERHPDEPFLAAAGAAWATAAGGASILGSGPVETLPDPLALAAVRAARRTADPVAARYLGHPSARVVLEAARAIHDGPIPAALPALAALTGDGRFRDTNWGAGVLAGLSNLNPVGPFTASARPPRDQVLRRALNARFRLGGAANARALAAVATDAGQPSSVRAEALTLLGAWGVLAGEAGNLPIKPTKDPNHGSVPTVNPENWPGWFDRVVGLWRPVVPRAETDAANALAPAIAVLVAESRTDVAMGAVEAATRLRLTGAGAALLARLRDPGSPVVLRQAVPAALAALDRSALRLAIPVALADTNTALRAAALPFLDRLEGDAARDTLSPIVRRGIRTGLKGSAGAAGDPAQATAPALPEADLRLAQAGLRVIGRMPGTWPDALLVEALGHLAAGSYPAELELDLREAAAERTAPDVRTALAQLNARSQPGDSLGRWRPTLVGGDAGRGRSIFLEKVEVQCSRCHQINREGGIVGPALDGLGRRQTREQILESIVRPNQAIAQGYESVVITLRNGTEYAGVVKSENDRELRLESGEDGLLTLSRADIAERRRSLSAMPEGLVEALTARELRDLVEFLATRR